MKFILIIITYFLSTQTLLGQTDSDFHVISSKRFYSENDFKYYKGDSNSQNVMQTRKHNLVYNINPVILILKGAMYAYQNCFSQQLSKQCPYEITCSNFAKLSIKEFGLFKGIIVASDRILRCNRISIMDYFPMDLNLVTGRLEDTPLKYR